MSQLDQQQPSRSLLHSAIIALLVLITMATFWRAFSCQFVDYDDSGYVVCNPQVLQGLTTQNVAWAFMTDRAGNYHPLTWLSLMLDTSVWGTQPQGYHVTNVVLHALAVVLLYLALNALTGSCWRSGLAALLFAIHPLRVESVAWISERKDVLSGCLAFATLLSYAAYARRPSWSRYLLVAILFILGLLAKPMLVTLPCLLLLLDIWPLRRLDGLDFGFRPARSDRELNRAALPAPSSQPPSCPPRSPSQLVLEKIPLFLLSLASCILTYIVQRRTVRGLNAVSIADRLSNVMMSYVRYLGKMVWFRELIVGYPFQNWSPAQVGAAAALLLLITTFVCLRFRRNPWLAIGWFWFGGMLIPVIGVVQAGPQAMADRYSYLPTIGLAIMLVWSLPDRLFHFNPGRLAAGTATLAVVTTLCAFAWRQIGYWHSSVTLFSHAVAFAPHDELLLTSLAKAYDVEEDNPDQALIYDRKAVEFNPGSADAQFNLGSLLNRLGRPSEAWVHLLQARQSQPDSAIAHHIQGLLDMNQKQFDLALGEFQRSLEVDQSFVPPHLNIGNILLMRKRFEQALAQYQQAWNLDPNDPDANILTAKALAILGRFQEAAPYLQKAIRLRPRVAQNYFFLGQLLIQLQRFEQAVPYFQKAVQLEPANSAYRAMLERAQAGAGRLTPEFQR